MEKTHAKSCRCKNSKVNVKAVDSYPGAAINVADDCKTDAKLVKERTSTLNNNPRNYE